MIIEKIIAHRDAFSRFEDYERDEVHLEWYELNKKVMRKTTQKGIEIGFRLDHNSETLKDEDIIFVEGGTILTVSVKPCSCIGMLWHDNIELARICYEIGNRHAPLFFSDSDENHTLLTPYDAPIAELLGRMGFHITIQEDRLIKPLSGNVAKHHH